MALIRRIAGLIALAQGYVHAQEPMWVEMPFFPHAIARSAVSTLTLTP